MLLRMRDNQVLVHRAISTAIYVRSYCKLFYGSQFNTQFHHVVSNKFAYLYEEYYAKGDMEIIMHV